MLQNPIKILFVMGAGVALVILLLWPFVKQSPSGLVGTWGDPTAQMTIEADGCGSMSDGRRFRWVLAGNLLTLSMDTPTRDRFQWLVFLQENDQSLVLSTPDAKNQVRLSRFE